jgi:hypothetical protein
MLSRRTRVAESALKGAGGHDRDAGGGIAGYVYELHGYLPFTK